MISSTPSSICWKSILISLSGMVSCQYTVTSGILLYIALKISRNCTPMCPTQNFNIRNSASSSSPFVISRLLATCPFLRASFNFFWVAGSVFSPPMPSFAKNCRL